MAFLRGFHRWLGLALAAIVLAVAATGGLLLLRDPYYRMVYPSLRQPVTSAESDGRATILTDIEARWPESVRLVKFPQPGLNAFHVWLHDGSEALVDPRTAAVIDHWRWTERLPAFLFELHAHLLAEPNGTLVNGFAAACVLFMGLTGIVVWWPGRQRAFRLRGVIPRRTTPGELLRSHAAVGAIAVIPIILFTGTGAAIVFYEPTAHVMSTLLDSRAPEEPSARVTPRDVATRPWSEILAALDDTFPDGHTVFYYPGSPTDARLMFRKRLPGEWHPNGRSYVLVDPYTADVIQHIDARAQGTGTRVMHAVYPVHSAKVGGRAMIALAAFAAVALTWLAAGGVWSYIGRRLLARRGDRRFLDQSSIVLGRNNHAVTTSSSGRPLA